MKPNRTTPGVRPGGLNNVLAGNEIGIEKYGVALYFIETTSLYCSVSDEMGLEKEDVVDSVETNKVLCDTDVIFQHKMFENVIIDCNLT